MLLLSAVQCESLSPPENGNFTFVGEAPDYMLYSIVEFTCTPGYTIADGQDYVLACTKHGTWSSNPPTCVPIACRDGTYFNCNQSEEVHCMP